MQRMVSLGPKRVWSFWSVLSYLTWLNDWESWIYFRRMDDIFSEYILKETSPYLWPANVPSEIIRTSLAEAKNWWQSCIDSSQWVLSELTEGCWLSLRVTSCHVHINHWILVSEVGRGDAVMQDKKRDDRHESSWCYRCCYDDYHHSGLLPYITMSDNISKLFLMTITRVPTRDSSIRIWVWIYYWSCFDCHIVYLFNWLTYKWCFSVRTGMNLWIKPTVWQVLWLFYWKSAEIVNNMAILMNMPLLYWIYVEILYNFSTYMSKDQSADARYRILSGC